MISNHNKSWSASLRLSSAENKMIQIFSLWFSLRQVSVKKKEFGCSQHFCLDRVPLSVTFQVFNFHCLLIQVNPLDYLGRFLLQKASGGDQDEMASGTMSRQQVITVMLLFTFYLLSFVLISV